MSLIEHDVLCGNRARADLAVASGIVPRSTTCVPQIRVGLVTRSEMSQQVKVVVLVTGNQMP
jgi:hypothetical protein